ncbi:MAG: hypothetical protein OXH61_04440, partial [Acidimicrobiaceae bacterium]|nr:hypothetical protein [Acidimicrobiaceae bacterium]
RTKRSTLNRIDRFGTFTGPRTLVVSPDQPLKGTEFGFSSHNMSHSSIVVQCHALPVDWQESDYTAGAAIK